MRTEAEIRGKLRKTEAAKRLKVKNFWHVLTLDIQVELLKWVLKEKAGRKK